MKKISALGIIALMFSLSIASVFAQDLTSLQDVTTPDHPIPYLFKQAQESSRLLFSFGDSDTEQRAEIAEEKAKEEEKLTLLNRTDLIPNVETRRQKLVDDVNKADIKDPAKASSIKSHLQNALVVLQRVQAKLQAKGIQAQGIATAINNIQANIARINNTRSTLNGCASTYGCR